MSFVRPLLFVTALIALPLSARAAERTLPVPPPASPPVAAPLPEPAPPFVEGSAATATPAGLSGLKVQPGLEVFVEYNLRLTRASTGNEWFHSFEIPRAHGSLRASYGPAQARLVVEAVRSASEGALLGVAGDSLVLRLRDASAGYRQGEWLSLDAGVIPTLTVPELDGSFNLRAVAPTPLESTGLSSPADLGATARVTFPRRYGFAAVGAYNGEGYTNRELNRGKNLELAAEIHPLPEGPLAPLGVFASYVIGSEGTAHARADRLTVALLWQGKRLRGGASFTHAWGVGERADQRSILLDAFLRAEPIDRLIFGVRGFSWQRDLEASGDRVNELTGAAGYHVVAPLEAFLAVTRTFPEARAAAALPGLDHWTFRVLSRVVF